MLWLSLIHIFLSITHFPSFSQYLSVYDSGMFRCQYFHKSDEYHRLSADVYKRQGFDKYYVDHTIGIWPQAAGGIPFNACQFQSKGDPITDLFEDLAAEQKARSTYDNILRVVKDPEVADPIRFLRAREVVHFQRFGETLRHLQEELDSKNF